MASVARRLASRSLARRGTNLFDTVGDLHNFYKNEAGGVLGFTTGGPGFGGIGGLALDGTPIETIEGNFFSYIEGIHKKHSVVAAAVVARSLILSQVHFKFRDRATKKLFTTDALEPLQRPQFSSRPFLLSKMELHASYAGTAFVHRVGDGLTLLDPGRTAIILASDYKVDPEKPQDLRHLPDVRVVGYRYFHRPGEWLVFGTNEVSHWSPEPDAFGFRGQSWVMSAAADIVRDNQASKHTEKFFEQGATPGMAIIWPEQVQDPDEFAMYKREFNEQHAGLGNAAKTIFLAGGPSIQQVGTHFDKIGMKDLSGGAETRIASRSRVPPVVLGIRESLQGSSLTQGNYAAARRTWGDGWVSGTIPGLLACLEHLIETPPVAELWHDRDEILFLQEDAKDDAEIRSMNAGALRQLVDAGFDPDAAVDAVRTGNFDALLGHHTGLTSSQLQAPAQGE